MTDKEQIMINGVDVSKCRYFCRYDDLCRDDNIGRVVRPLCKRMPDCYFKQLARKTQECEELKEENQKLEMQLCNECGERDDYNIPCKMIRDLDYGLQMELEENACYRKAFEEIEKVCLEDTRTFADGTQVRYDSLDEILDIINKAKGADNAIRKYER